MMITQDKMAKMSKDLTAIIKWVEEQADKQTEVNAPVAELSDIEDRLVALEKLAGKPGKKRKSICARLDALEKPTK